MPLSFDGAFLFPPTDGGRYEQQKGRRTLATSAILGYPRIGSDRELKRVTEAFWRDQASMEELLATAKELRRKHWQQQADAGIDSIPSNDFSLYDQVLDTICLVGAVPERFGWSGGEVDLATYFAMARGIQTEERDAQAMEMTKWFDTNYHYIVPELSPDLTFSLSSSKPFEEWEEAKQLGIITRPVLIGPVSFLLLGKAKGVDNDWNPLSLLDNLLPVYEEVVRRFAELGVPAVQFDEPCFVQDRGDEERSALARAYQRLAAQRGETELWVQTYFGTPGDSLSTLLQLPVQAIGLDFVRGGRELVEQVLNSDFPADKKLVAGVVDGRNIWINNLDHSVSTLRDLEGKVGTERLVVAPSCSLLHVPYDVEGETALDAELRSWLAFAVQKLTEVATLTRILNGLEDTPEVQQVLEANRAARIARENSPRTHNPAVRERVAALRPEDARRKSSFAVRRKVQAERIPLPLLPTTTIGSFPQTTEIRRHRNGWRRGEISQEEYEAFIKGTIKEVIRLQEDIGLDVLVHGESERNDMVEYFGEQLEGFAFTQNGWVQSYGTRCVKPPVLYGDVSRPAPMTVDWIRTAQSFTDKPVKGMLTGPVTILNWSFVRDDQPRAETARQIALAIRDEVNDLEAAGIAIIQVDEAALREGLPLRRAEWKEYLGWAVECYRLATSGVRDDTQIHVHMCYSEFNDILESISELDADVISIENSRSHAELLNAFQEFHYDKDIGPGVYDIHSPRVPTVQEMTELLRRSLQSIQAERLWVNPDCGLKTRGYEETIPALRNMVEAARIVREELVGKTG